MKQLKISRTHHLADLRYGDEGQLLARLTRRDAYLHLAETPLDRQYVQFRMKVVPTGAIPKRGCYCRLYYLAEGMRRFDRDHSLELWVKDFENLHTYTFQCIPFQQQRILQLRLHPVNCPAEVELRDFRVCDYEPVVAEKGGADKLGLIFLSYYSRTGSTLAMKVLTRHPQIAGHTAGTHDANILKYFSKLYYMFLTSHIPAGRTGRKVMLDRYQRYIRHNRPEYALPKPFEFNRYMHLEPFRQHYSRFIQEYLPELLSNIEAANRDTARYYIEKQMDAGALLDSMLDLFPQARIIAIFRDPRDVFVSLAAFEQQERIITKEFSPSKRVAEIMDHYAARVRLVRGNSDRATSCRYEDLMARPEEVVRDLVEFLGLDSSPEIIGRMVDVLDRRDLQASQHLTARHPAETVGRWKQELPRKYVRLFRRRRETLSELGYEP